MQEPKLSFLWILGLLIPLATTGCLIGPAYTGSFERNLTLQGPVHLELSNGSGSAVIRSGEPGQVRVHGNVRAHSVFFGNARAALDDLLKNPPVTQQGNTVRIGQDGDRLRFVSIDYTVYTPAETQVHTAIGSGSIEVRRIEGPLAATTGSGQIIASDIREEAQVTSGSGSIRLENIGGTVLATAGSGNMTILGSPGDVRATTGSGSIQLQNAPGRLNLRTGSGSIRISGASGDLRASAGSGRISVDGNPAANSYWELQTSSGGVELRVPSNASFRLYARTSSGRIATDIPLMIEEQSRRELRARVGGGAARVDVRCTSGSIRIE